jgi:hypothetical protein
VLKKGAEERIFTPGLAVVVMKDGEPVVRGQWRCEAAEDGGRTNAIRYTFDAADAEAVAVRWSFNDNNQLVAVIPAAVNGGADSAAFAFAGRIKVDDNRDVAYELIDAEGQPTGQSLTVFGELGFNESDNALEVRFADGGAPARVSGDSGLGSLTTGMYPFDDFKGSDFLRFQASTINELPNRKLAILPADIQWVGNWDLQANRLVFAAELKSDAGARGVNIVLAGRTKAVAGGLAYFVGPDGSQQLALQVGGTHRWNGTEVQWDVALGFTEKKLTARLAGGVTVQRQSGEQFTLRGSLAFVEAGRDTTLEMELEAVYQWGPGGILRFNAAVSMDNGALNYNLQLEGQFDYDGTRLTFAIQFTRDGSGDKLVIGLGVRGESGFSAKLMLVLNLDDPSKVNLQLRFQMSMKWIDGIPVKEKPRAVA